MKAFSVYNLKMNSLINILSPSIISNHVWSMVYSKESTHCAVYSTLACLELPGGKNSVFFTSLTETILYYCNESFNPF